MQRLALGLAACLLVAGCTIARQDGTPVALQTPTHSYSAPPRTTQPDWATTPPPGPGTTSTTATPGPTATSTATIPPPPPPPPPPPFGIRAEVAPGLPDQDVVDWSLVDPGADRSHLQPYLTQAHGGAAVHVENETSWTHLRDFMRLQWERQNGPDPDPDHSEFDVLDAGEVVVLKFERT